MKAWIAAMSALGTLLAGCGESADTPSAASPTPSSETPQSSETPEPTEAPPPTEPTASRAGSPDASASSAAVHAAYLGRWSALDGRLVIRDDGSARSRIATECPAEWSSTGCTEVMEMKVRPQGERLRLTVQKTLVEDGSGRSGYAEFPRASAGSFYLMTLRPDGAARTELHNDDGVVRGANGLGNPFVCRPDSAAAREGVCQD